MRKLLVSLLFGTVLLAQNYNLILDVKDLRNDKGVVRFSLYNDSKDFPDEELVKYYKQLSANIVNHSAKVVFKNLPEGRYVAHILHDENKNSKLDKGFLLPEEGVGLSNYKTINLIHRPNFKDGSFLLDSDKSITIIVNYF